MPYLKSITTGDEIPCEIKKKSFFRKIFFLPSVKVEYVYDGLSGPVNKVSWRYPSEVHGL